MSLLIGLVDQAIGPSDKVSWGDSKIGGQPVWMTNSKSIAVQKKCPGCSVALTLVVQLYCPLSNSAYHRCLYILVCTSTGCPQHNSWKVYRGMQYDETYAPAKSKKEASPKLFDNEMWTDGQDDWGDSDEDDDDWGTGNGDFSDYGSDDDLNTNTTASNSIQKHSNEILSSRSSSNLDMSQLPPSLNNKDLQVQTACNDVIPRDPIAQSKDMSGDSSSHIDIATTDEDLSACFATMDVEGSSGDIAGGGREGGGDALMEDLDVPDTCRLDQLASVLNTKYKDSAPAEQPSSRRPVLLKPYYLSVVEGSGHISHNATEDGHIASLIRNYEEVEGKQMKDIISERAQTKVKGGSEVYEKSNVKHGDKVFHKFWKEIQKFPEQCIRYDRCGQPLLVQSLSPIQSIVPPCTKCGSSRVFEFQLVPALIPWLCSQEGKHSEIEFGAVLIYTCNKSCPPSTSDGLDLLEEHVILQHDPDHHLYR